MNNTIAQIRSEFALEQIQTLKGDKKSKEEFGKLVAGLPAMVLQNGFGHTLAFLLAKGTDKHTQAFEIIVKWLKNRRLVSNTSAEVSVKELSTMPQSQYVMAQNEALEVLEWVKRYANAGLFLK